MTNIKRGMKVLATMNLGVQEHGIQIRIPENTEGKVTSIREGIAWIKWTNTEFSHPCNELFYKLPLPGESRKEMMT